MPHGATLGRGAVAKSTIQIAHRSCLERATSAVPRVHGHGEREGFVIINSDPAKTLHGTDALIFSFGLGWDAQSQIKYSYSDRPKTLQGAVDLGGIHGALAWGREARAKYKFRSPKDLAWVSRPLHRHALKPTHFLKRMLIKKGQVGKVPGKAPTASIWNAPCPGEICPSRRERQGYQLIKLFWG